MTNSEYIIAEVLADLRYTGASAQYCATFLLEGKAERLDWVWFEDSHPDHIEELSKVPDSEKESHIAYYLSKLSTVRMLLNMLDNIPTEYLNDNLHGFIETLDLLVDHIQEIKEDMEIEQ